MSEDKYSESWLKDKLEKSRMSKYPSNRIYWWVTTIHDGKMMVLGYKLTEDEAYRFGYDNCQESDYKVTPLRTRDTTTAVRQLKGIILNETHDLDKATEKFAHPTVEE